MVQNLDNLYKFFDKDYYVIKNKDLNDYFKNEPIEHFIKYGHKENRHPCDLDIFNWDLYAKMNNLENNITKLKIHFITIGLINNYPILINNTNLEKIFLKDLFNLEYYKNKYTDLKLLNNNELINHFINFGYLEGRSFNINSTYSCEINTNNLIEINLDIINYKYDSNKYLLNLKFYKYFNKDLENLNTDQLIYHFKNTGYKEKRIFCDIHEEFNIDYYLNTNKIDNDFSDNYEIWKHYLYIGYFNGFTYNDTHINNYIKNKKYVTCVIYVYYNRPGEYKNETNLSFFINQTIKNRDSVSDNVEFLFIINNYYTEVNIPEQHNIHVLKNKNTFDFESYLIGIKYLENKYNKSIEKLYENILFMNCSCTGPFINKNEFWLQPFYEKLKFSVCCTSILTLLENTNNLISGPQIPGYCFIVNSNYIKLLINNNNIKLNGFSRSVFGSKKNKYDCIISGEHCISVVLLKNNLNISGICNANVDYRNNKYNHLLKFNADRHPVYNFSPYKSIFIKNQWRIDNNTRDSHPVNWSQTLNEIEKLDNLIYFKYDYNNIEYNLLNISHKGYVKFNNCYWNSKQEFYKIFGESEEFIIFPKSNCSKTIKYFHNDNTVKRYVIEEIKVLLHLNFKVLFYTNLTKPFNFNIPNTITTILNNNYDILKLDSNSLGSHLLFPCTNLSVFENELNNNCFSESIISINTYNENKTKYFNNKYINFLTMYW